MSLGLQITNTFKNSTFKIILRFIEIKPTKVKKETLNVFLTLVSYSMRDCFGVGVDYRVKDLHVHSWTMSRFQPNPLMDLFQILIELNEILPIPQFMPLAHLWMEEAHFVWE